MTQRPRRILVHTPAQAEAALAAAAALGRAVTLQTPPQAAALLGPAYLRDLVAAAAARHPGVTATLVVDCGDAPGHALAALRAGLDVVRISCAAETRARLADIAGQRGAVLDDADPLLLDLTDEARPHEACRAWLLAE